VPVVRGPDGVGEPQRPDAVAGDVAGRLEDVVAAVDATAPVDEHPERRLLGQVEGLPVDAVPGRLQVDVAAVDHLDLGWLGLVRQHPLVPAVGQVRRAAPRPRQRVVVDGGEHRLLQALDVDGPRRLDLPLHVPGLELPVEMVGHLLQRRERDGFGHRVWVACRRGCINSGCG
jgi:hypothetical protein